MNPKIIKPLIACVAFFIAGCYLFIRPENALTKSLCHGKLTPRKAAHIFAFGLWGFSLALAVTVLGVISKCAWLAFVAIAILLIVILCVESYEDTESK